VPDTLEAAATVFLRDAIAELEDLIDRDATENVIPAAS
jgi:hypothetical protein